MSNHKTTTNHDSTADHKVDIFMPIYIGDYLKDTTFLTTEQHGAYLLMLFACWQHGAIPNNDRVICRITGLSQEAWEDAKQTIIPYFKIDNGNLRHSRIDRELASAREKKNRQSVRGRAGADARWNATSNATSNASGKKQAMLKQCPSPSPSPSPSESSLKPKSEDAEDSFITCMDALKADQSFDNAVKAVYASNDSFRTVSRMHIENSLKEQPDRSMWHPAIAGMAAKFAGVEMQFPNKSLQNWLAGKPEHASKTKRTVNFE